MEPHNCQRWGPDRSTWLAANYCSFSFYNTNSEKIIKNSMGVWGSVASSGWLPPVLFGRSWVSCPFLGRVLRGRLPPPLFGCSWVSRPFSGRVLSPVAPCAVWSLLGQSSVLGPRPLYFLLLVFNGWKFIQGKKNIIGVHKLKLFPFEFAHVACQEWNYINHWLWKVDNKLDFWGDMDFCLDFIFSWVNDGTPKYRTKHVQTWWGIF